MRAFAREVAPLRILLLRALLGFVLLRSLLFVVAALLGAFAGPGAGEGIDSPLGVILLSAVLGAVDVRRRGESFFWANLGYSPLIAPCLFGAVALLAELGLAWLRA